ncbi:MAG TPA: sigma-70 family RNA polymerase sigma factor [Actinomycetes bacterium]|nr:sigma-70 family RNA polymerase sigma factor [Actinomycetes bacterium]
MVKAAISALRSFHEGWLAVTVENPSRVSEPEPARPPMDDVSRAWVAGLTTSGPAHEGCVTALHGLLLRVARHEVARRSGSLRVQGRELEDIAQQATDDSLMAIRSKIASFRGDSRFTTWAYRFVMFEVSTKMGRHFWRDHRATLDEDAWEQMPDLRSSSPDQHSVHRELFAALRRAIDQDLTALQRRVFVAIALNEVPMDAFARELGTSRNAIYKTLFDARRKLRASLSAAGYQPPFSAVGSQ